MRFYCKPSRARRVARAPQGRRTVVHSESCHEPSPRRSVNLGEILCNLVFYAMANVTALVDVEAQQDSLEFLACRPHVKLVGPQARPLVVQEQIRLSNPICAHLLSSLLILSVFINNRTVSNGVHNVNSSFTHLTGQCLCQLSNRSPSGSVRSELSIAAKCTESTREDECLSED